MDTKNSPHILSEGVPGDVVAYATNCYVEHLQVAVHNPDSFDLPVNDLSLYMLGHPFKQYMDDTSYSTYYFPVIYSGTVVGILTVTDMGSRITSSYSKAFAEALNEFSDPKPVTLLSPKCKVIFCIKRQSLLPLM